VKALNGRIPASVLGDALLVVSELVTNSVRHSGAPAGGVVLRVHLTKTMVRLEVEDRGRGPLVALRTPETDGQGGYGLNIVHEISERWGFERAAAGGARFWAQLEPSATPPPRRAGARG